MRSRPVLILTEATPNPEAMKFTPEVKLVGEGGWCFDRATFDSAASPLAAALFEIAGVARVFIAPDFVTVTRAPDGPGWPELRLAILAALAAHIGEGAPAVAAEVALAAPVDSLEAEIQLVLAAHVRPGVARDGGDVLFDHFDRETGRLWIRMQGACGGCPSARLTLKAGVEQIVRRYVPEVSGVEEVAPSRPVDGSGARWTRWAGSLLGRSVPAPRTVFSHAGREIQREAERKRAS
jgi:Fe-S cluster biogenesis protein NfuA